MINRFDLFNGFIKAGVGMQKARKSVRALQALASEGTFDYRGSFDNGKPFVEQIKWALKEEEVTNGVE